MTFESLVRDAVADQADRAVDPRTVLSGLRRGRHSRRPLLVFAAATAVVAAVAVAVIPQIERTVTEEAAAPPSTPVTVLLLGRDAYESTDTVVLLRLDGPRAEAIAFPRDTFVDIPGHGENRLSRAYQLGARTGGPQAGAATAMATVSALAGVRVDHYAVVEMAAVAPVVDAIGGVEVTLCAAVRDTVTRVDFPAGRQRLDGERTLSFLRQRHGLANGDLDRTRRQQQVLAGVLRGMGAVDPATLAAAAGPAVTSDADIVGLAARFRQATLTWRMIPIDGEASTDAGYVLRATPETVREFVAAPPTDTAGPDCVN